MHVDPKAKHVNLEGVARVVRGQRCLIVNNDAGDPVLLIATGAVVPENWEGRAVRIVVEDIQAPDPEHFAPRHEANEMKRVRYEIRPEQNGYALWLGEINLGFDNDFQSLIDETKIKLAALWDEYRIPSALAYMGVVENFGRTIRKPEPRR